MAAQPLQKTKTKTSKHALQRSRSVESNPSGSPTKPSKPIFKFLSSESRPDQLKNWKEDLFGDGLIFYDFLVSLDSYLDLFKRQTFDPLKNEWESRAGSISAELRLDRIRLDDLPANLRIQRSQTEIELREFAERELSELKAKLKLRRDRIHQAWNDSKTISFREKTSFFFGVQNVLGTALLLAFWPEYITLSYTLQAAYYLPLRVYTYRQQAYHYFLFDICYVINGLCLIFIWFMPSNVLLLQACYGLSHGPSAIAIATWRNSLVFHSVEKVTSLFIHIYPPLVFTVIRHYLPNASERYPALKELDSISVPKTLVICSTIHIIWQTLYYRFVIIARANKISQLGRPTSFTYLLNSKTGLISKLLQKIRPDRRAHSFMVAQFVYTIITMLPSLIWFYQSKMLSGLFLWLMFSVSAWNGASFYVEVFGRRFEKELNALKKELDQLNRDSESSVLSNQDDLGNGVGVQEDEEDGLVVQPHGKSNRASGYMPASQDFPAPPSLKKRRTNGEAEVTDQDGVVVGAKDVCEELGSS